MDDIDFKVKREIQELRAEVRRLRRTVEAGFVVLGLAAVMIFPQLLTLTFGPESSAHALFTNCPNI